MTQPICHCKSDQPSTAPEPEQDPADMFVPNSTFLSNQNCPHFFGTAVLVPCTVCPPDRCWFIEMADFRKAGMPALTPRAWRRHVVTRELPPAGSSSDQDADTEGSGDEG